MVGNIPIVRKPPSFFGRRKRKTSEQAVGKLTSLTIKHSSSLSCRRKASGNCAINFDDNKSDEELSLKDFAADLICEH